MKIVICGSMSFAKKIVEVANRLKKNLATKFSYRRQLKDSFLENGKLGIPNSPLKGKLNMISSRNTIRKLGKVMRF